MSFRFQIDEPVAVGVRRIVNEQIDRALRDAEDVDVSIHERVHQVRKRCKKIRGVARLARPSLDDHYASINAAFRDTARPLSALRDAQALVELIEDIDPLDGDEASADDRHNVREALVRRRDRSAGDVDVLSLLRTAQTRLDEHRATPRTWPIREDGFEALAGGWKKVYRRGRKARRVAASTQSAEDHHEWRKRVKYLWYHLRLLRPVWTGPMRALADEAHEVSGLLGSDHDVAVLRERVAQDAGLAEVPGMDRVLTDLSRRSARWRREAHGIGRRLHEAKPKRIVRLLRAWSETSGCPAAG